MCRRNPSSRRRPMRPTRKQGSSCAQDSTRSPTPWQRRERRPSPTSIAARCESDRGRCGGPSRRSKPQARCHTSQAPCRHRRQRAGGCRNLCSPCLAHTGRSRYSRHHHRNRRRSQSSASHNHWCRARRKVPGPVQTAGAAAMAAQSSAAIPRRESESRRCRWGTILAGGHSTSRTHCCRGRRTRQSPSRRCPTCRCRCTRTRR